MVLVSCLMLVFYSLSVPSSASSMRPVLQVLVGVYDKN